MADGPLTNLANLYCRTDANGYLIVNVAVGGGGIGTGAIGDVAVYNSTTTIAPGTTGVFTWSGGLLDLTGNGSANNGLKADHVTLVGNSYIQFGGSNQIQLQGSTTVGTQNLTLPVIRQAETVAIKPQQSLTSSATPALTATTASFVMLGLAAPITPQVTGRILCLITAVALNSILADGLNAKVAFGTGTAPVNGAAASGTVVGGTKHFVASTAAGQQGLSWSIIATGLTLGTAAWFDLQFQAVTGGNATLKDVDVTLVEI